MSKQMTREQILAMEPGSELDMLVAVNVFGCEPAFNSLPGYPRVKSENDMYSVPVENYSTNISAAWEVEDQFNQDSEVRSDYMIGLYMIVGLQPHLKPSLDDLFLIAHATPEQRCKAALLAVMVL